MKYLFNLLLILIICPSLQAQFAIDGNFNDWQVNPTIATKNVDSKVPLLEIGNDAERLYFHLRLAEEVKLYEASHSGNTYLKLYIDADNNPSTGLLKGPVGAELVLDLGSRSFYAYSSSGSSQQIYWPALGFKTLPTVTAQEHEFTVLRNSGQYSLSDTIVIVAEEIRSRELFPSEGKLEYIFTQSGASLATNLSFARPEKGQIRAMSYNLLHDGMTDLDRRESLGKIIASALPDVAILNENWNTTHSQAQYFLRNYVSNAVNWQVAVYGGGNILASRWPITESWTIEGGSNARHNASLVDLPESISRQDLLVISLHLPCCTNDGGRQQGVDAVAAFIRDAKTPGGAINLPDGTPILIGGDLNLVGYAQQLTTLLEGDIQDNHRFGADFSPDWDGSGLRVDEATQTHSRETISWYDEGSSFPPGKLDYIVYTDSRLNLLHSFVINTRNMDEIALTEAGLYSTDSYGSDHLPVVADFSVLPEDLSIPSVPTEVSICNSEEIPAIEAQGENISWYSDRALSQKVAAGNTYTPEMNEPGWYSYWLTQTLAGQESGAARVDFLLKPNPELSIPDYGTVYTSDDNFLLEGYPSGGQWYEGTNPISNIFEPTNTSPGNYLLSYEYEAPNGCRQSQDVSITVEQEPLGNAADEFDDRIIYPNPARDIVNIQFEVPTQGTACIISADGKILSVRGFRQLSHWEVPVNFLAKGLYILEINQDSKTQRIRLVRN
jgi:endonuclease/exonuclease/phosphatase family metal-dependent hydrolase